MLAFRNVTRRFRSPGGDVIAARDISLDIPPGGVWAVVGPNGAGKTTLFGLALGFLRPTEGRVTLDGDEPRRFVRRRGAAYLPERFSLPGGWRVRAALHAFARLDGMGAAVARARADTVLERLGLERHAERPVGALSRGLLQRVGLAQALLADRPVVVLDEPTEGLDPLWRIRLRDLVTELRNPDRLVLVASHALAEVERVADRVVLLEDGRIMDILDAAGPGDGPLRYRIRLARPSPAVADVFPDATMVRRSPDSTTAYIVAVADAPELSQRLAALLDHGVTLVEATPVVEPLEERVRRALDRPDAAAADRDARDPASTTRDDPSGDDRALDDASDHGASGDDSAGDGVSGGRTGA
jgi:ABC-2 type transport system ATP-binding protein